MVEIMLVAVAFTLFTMAALYAISGAPGDWIKRVEEAYGKKPTPEEDGDE